MKSEEGRDEEATPIRINEVYRLAEFQRRTGLGRAGVRAASRKGLRISKCGRNKYVAGNDWATFLQTQSSEGKSDRVRIYDTEHENPT